MKVNDQVMVKGLEESFGNFLVVNFTEGHDEIVLLDMFGWPRQLKVKNVYLNPTPTTEEFTLKNWADALDEENSKID